MITTTDPEYVETRRLVLGGEKLRPPFDEAAKWIAEKFDVRVLNVIYDPQESDELLHAPRLQVILETEADEAVFRGKDGNFLKRKQLEISKRFSQLVESDPAFNTNGMFVVFSAFAAVARTEAQEAVSSQEVEALQMELANEELWKIVQIHGYVTFMFFTKKQAKKAEKDGLRAKYARRYFDLLRRYDKFGSVVDDMEFASFDSKENFEKNYGGSWYNYFR